jgi:hypothetical protein
MQYPANSSVVIITSTENNRMYKSNSPTCIVNVGTKSPAFIHDVGYREIGLETTTCSPTSAPMEAKSTFSQPG